MTRLLLTVSAAMMAGSLGCIGLAADEAINDRGRFTDQQVGYLLFTGYLGAHLSVLPAIAADCDVRQKQADAADRLSRINAG